MSRNRLQLTPVKYKILANPLPAISEKDLLKRDGKLRLVKGRSLPTDYPAYAITITHQIESFQEVFNLEPGETGRYEASFADELYSAFKQEGLIVYEENISDEELEDLCRRGMEDALEHYSQMGSFALDNIGLQHNPEAWNKLKYVNFPGCMYYVLKEEYLREVLYKEEDVAEVDAQPEDVQSVDAHVETSPTPVKIQRGRPAKKK